MVFGVIIEACAAPVGGRYGVGGTPPLFYWRGMAEQSLEAALEERTESLGFELVELERAGSKTRPVLRVRVDRPDAEPGQGVSLDDCARVSRALEAYLDGLPGMQPRYVLEVSSPGVERPLVRRRDFERFRGREVTLRGHAPLAGRGRRLQGELLGLEDGPDGEAVRLRLEDGEEVVVPREGIARAQLVFRWNG
jgi:ribosome maturation factor RimP